MPELNRIFLEHFFVNIHRLLGELETQILSLKLMALLSFEQNCPASCSRCTPKRSFDFSHVCGAALLIVDFFESLYCFFNVEFRMRLGREYVPNDAFFVDYVRHSSFYYA